MGSYIKIDRKILDWEWYSDINTCRLFLHMLLKANWRPGRFQGIEVPRGSFISSIPKLAEETGLTERKARTALEHLKMTGEVSGRSHSKFTVFTIKNYNCYQSTDTQNDRQATGKRQADDRQPTTIEEGKKEKRKEIKDIVDTPRRKAGPTSFTEESFEMQCVNALVQSCLRQFPGAKVPATAAEKSEWCVHVERMKRLDGRSEADIQEALQFAIQDPFWQTNIRSTKKLREKFETLILQARRPKQSGAKKAANRFHNLEEHGYDYDKMVWEMMNNGS
ncbi:hypothetical protein [[Clostridium] symbiosum]|uniref:hypothetical protein n=1 Tax=Clostridium symbiosum TaxID=1512 RepID=UPI00192388B9|nr:hypothetical protein [[Clostridium] symbiosum]MDB2010587.1 hypothetical protein [[Clostridium] symbiosum]MDB2029042.1 hypothetical protein [[Clostridium] symbiosum]MDB2032181.1 hypothetical protein [[Clostridium] symbiosum]